MVLYGPWVEELWVLVDLCDVGWENLTFYAGSDPCADGVIGFGGKEISLNVGQFFAMVSYAFF